MRVAVTVKGLSPAQPLASARHVRCGDMLRTHDCVHPARGHVYVCIRRHRYVCVCCPHVHARVRAGRSRNRRSARFASSVRRHGTARRVHKRDRNALGALPDVLWNDTERRRGRRRASPCARVRAFAAATALRAHRSAAHCPHWCARCPCAGRARRAPALVVVHSCVSTTAQSTVRTG